MNNNNILLNKHPHLKNIWIDLSKLINLTKNELIKKKIEINNIKEKPEDWTIYIKMNFVNIVDTCTKNGWEDDIESIMVHPNPHIQLYAEAVSMIEVMKSIIYWLNKKKAS